MPIVTFATQEFAIANYMGTRYGNVHTNWVNQDFESFFNPIVGRALTQKPTFGKLPLYDDTYSSNSEFDVYTFFLAASDENITVISNTVGALSAFFASHEPKSPKLGNVLASLSGSLLFSHSIEPPTLPTWTGIKLFAQTGTDRSDKEFAADHKFMVDKKTFKGSLKWPTDTTDLTLDRYALEKKDHDKSKIPNPRVTFDPSTHVTPYVLYFQPYDVNASSLSLTILAGLKIELAEIDGFTVPVEHPESSLDDNNSQYLQSAVRLSQIKAINASSAYTNENLRVLARRRLDRTNQAIAAAFRSMARNVFPVLANKNISESTTTMVGMKKEDNHDQASTSFTFTAGENGLPDIHSDFKIYAWSSYRVVHKYKKPDAGDVSMVLSFRPIYGQNVTLSRSKNPALIVPH